MPDTKQGEKDGATLKPCPFCAHGEQKNTVTNAGTVHVTCPVCLADCYGRFWNLRPIEDALKQRVKVLEEALEIAKASLEYYCQRDDGKNPLNLPPGAVCPQAYSALEHIKALAPPVGEKEKS